LRELVDLEVHSALFAGEDANTPLPLVRPSDPAQIQYTSGTTGFPKGVVLHHRGLINNARFSGIRMGARPGDTCVSAMPLFHTAGCALTTLGAAQFGTRMILMRIFDPTAILRVIEGERADWVMGVPTMLVALLEAQAAQPRDISSVRSVITGGAMVPPELARRVRDVFGCEVHIVYGQTEASCLLTIATCGDGAPADEVETVGQPIAHTEIAIREPGGREILPLGAVGEICARGYGTLPEYNDDPAATAAAVDPEGWLRTGDLGSMDAQGRVRITGRVKEMIIRGGENLFPAEIENVLLEHPDVLEAAVVGAPDERLGEVVVAFLRLAPGAMLDRPALVAHCRAHLAAPKTPAHWVEVQGWPLTGSGKIQKFVLRESFLATRAEAS
jgi:fatty-acyl-CoA synthase